MSTSTEDAVIEIWGRHIDTKVIRSTDDFFALGGHSLAGMRILGDIRAAYTVEITPLDFYLNPTPAALAARIDAEAR